MASSAELSTSFGSNAERVRALSNRSRPRATFYRYLAVAAAGAIHDSATLRRFVI